MASVGTPDQCAVCGDSVDIPNSGTHFVPLACKQCVNFFNLGFRGRGCKSGGSCTITKSTRTACIACRCRYDKCKEVGIGMASNRRKIRETQDNVEKVRCIEDCYEKLDINTGQSIDSMNLKLETIFEDVGHSTHSNKDKNSLNLLQEDSDIKLAELIMGQLGLSCDLTFDLLTKENQILVGNRLELILGIVGSGALVSLINTILNDSDVKKLASMRGIIAKGSLHDLNDSQCPENVSTIIEDEIKDDETDRSYRPKELRSGSVAGNTLQEGSSLFPDQQPSTSALKGEKCLDCGKIFKNKHSLKGHRRELHSGVTETHSCPECGKKFGQKRYLKAHRESLHYGKTFPCQLCDRIFTKNSSMKEHIMRTHRIDDS